MITTKFIKAAGLATAVVTITGCQSFVEGLNDDPNNFTDITLELALNQAQLNMASISGAFPAHVAAMWSDQFTGTDRQYITYDQYGIGNNDFNDTWLDLYQRGIVQSQEAKQQASEQGASVLQGIATITEGYYFGEAASMFGDVPFAQVNQYDEFPDPQYDDMQSVLRGAVALLDEGIALVGDANVSTLSGNIFSTNASWAAIANGLKARYLLGLEDYAGAYNAAVASGISTPAQDLEVISTTTDFGENLWWQFEVEQRTTYLTIGDDVLGLSYFQQLLTDSTDVSRSGDDDKTNDSLRYNYFIQPGDASADGVRYNVTDGWAAQTANLPVFTAVELQLILAEAAARTDREDEAIEALNNARNYWDALLGGDSYEDLDDDDFDGDDDLIRDILIEKYLSVIGLPAFYDVNRTNNLIGVPSELDRALAKRFLYPQIEESSNSNFPGVIPLATALPLYN